MTPDREFQETTDSLQEATQEYPLATRSKKTSLLPVLALSVMGVTCVSPQGSGTPPLPQQPACWSQSETGEWEPGYWGVCAVEIDEEIYPRNSREVATIVERERYRIGACTRLPVNYAFPQNQTAVQLLCMVENKGYSDSRRANSCFGNIVVETGGFFGVQRAQYSQSAQARGDVNQSSAWQLYDVPTAGTYTFRFPAGANDCRTTIVANHKLGIYPGNP